MRIRNVFGNNKESETSSGLEILMGQEEVNWLEGNSSDMSKGNLLKNKFTEKLGETQRDYKVSIDDNREGIQT